MPAFHVAAQAWSFRVMELALSLLRSHRAAVGFEEAGDAFVGVGECRGGPCH